jgi:hypothetical protein
VAANHLLKRLQEFKIYLQCGFALGFKNLTFIYTVAVNQLQTSRKPMTQQEGFVQYDVVPKELVMLKKLLEK